MRRARRHPPSAGDAGPYAPIAPLIPPTVGSRGELAIPAPARTMAALDHNRSVVPLALPARATLIVHPPHLVTALLAAYHARAPDSRYHQRHQHNLIHQLERITGQRVAFVRAVGRRVVAVPVGMDLAVADHPREPVGFRGPCSPWSTPTQEPYVPRSDLLSRRSAAQHPPGGVGCRAPGGLARRALLHHHAGPVCG